MNGRKEVTLNLWFAFVAFYVCFKHFFMDDNFLYIILDVLFFTVVIKGIYGNIKMKGNVCWCLYIVLVIDMIISVFYADNFMDAVKFTAIYLNIIMIVCWFSQMSGWQFIYYKWLKIGCLFHLCFTLFSVVFTDQALTITGRFLSNEVQQATIAWAQGNRYAGISGQTGTNAFFFSVLIGLFLAEICIGRRNRLWTGSLFFVSWAGLWLTGKKGLMIAALLSGLAVYAVAGDRFYKKIVFLLTDFGALLMPIVIIVFWDRVYQIFYSSIVSRLRIMDGMFEAIGQNPVLGNGVNSIGQFTYEGRLGHNIYLQMWVEQGVVGLGILLVAIFFTLYVTYIRMKRSVELKNKRVTYCFSFYIQVFVIIYGFFGNPMYDYNFAITYFLSIAAGFADESVGLYERGGMKIL